MTPLASLTVIARGTSSGLGIAIALGLTIVVVFLSFWFSKEAKLKRSLKSAKRWPICELPEDTIGKVVGAARSLGDTLRGPISGRTCVAYEVIVSQQQGKSTVRVIHEAMSVPFMIEDPSGRAIVDPRGADLALTFDKVTSSGAFDAATQIEEAFLARHGKESRGWVFNKGLTYREAMIEVGETVAILGSGVREPDPDAAPSAEYRGTQPTRLRLTNARSQKLVISDDPGTTH